MTWLVSRITARASAGQQTVTGFVGEAPEAGRFITFLQKTVKRTAAQGQVGPATSPRTGHSEKAVFSPK